MAKDDRQSETSPVLLWILIALAIFGVAGSIMIGLYLLYLKIFAWFP